MSIFTIIFIILNIPALIAMVVLLNRNNKLKIYQRISWCLLLLVSPIISLVLFTVQKQSVSEGYFH